MHNNLFPDQMQQEMEFQQRTDKLAELQKGEYDKLAVMFNQLKQVMSDPVKKSPATAAGNFPNYKFV